MARTSRLFLSSLLLTFFLLPGIQAQNPIFDSTATPPVIDGIADAMWDAHEAEAIANNNWGVVSSGTDLNGNFKICWDAINLYVLVVMNDDVLNSDDAANTWEDDGFELYLDIGNDKASSYGADDYQYMARYNDATLYESKYNQVAGAEMMQLSSANTVTFELSLPWSTLGATTIEHGDLIGLDVHFNDDDGGAREGKLAWFTTEDNSHKNPSVFGTASLGIKPTLPQAKKPDFSHKRGFYTESFSLNLSCEMVDTDIKYTLDGSDPRSSSSAITTTNPSNILIDPTSTTNRGGLTPTVVVRASSSKTGMDDSDIRTHSYIFIEQVKTQDAPGGIWPAVNFPNWGWNQAQRMDYAMANDIVTHPAYQDSIDDALLQIPSLSIVTDNKHLFDDGTGIYMNSPQQGSAWERPASIELLNPDSSDGFQINAGLRIRGGYSRIPTNPKHSFRLFFRKEYGESKLKHPMFEDEGTDEYDKIDLRTAQNYAWSNGGNKQNNFLKDVTFRDIQGKMGHPYTRSRYYHLYVNGMYWGLYQTEERPEARFAAEYFGGDKVDYDVVKPERNIPNPPEDLKVVATDGTMDAAERLWNKVIAGFTTNESYFQAQGMNVDGSRNHAYERLLDIENMIDYMQLAFYGGSYDAPISGWSTDPIRPNNYFAIYNRNNPDGFKWFVHDFEHTMNNKEDHENAGGLEEDWILNWVNLSRFTDDLYWFNPMRMHLELMFNEEYKIKFADRAYKNFSDGGMLSPDSIQAVWNHRKSQFDKAIIAESARWGNTSVNPSRDKDDWLTQVNYLQNNYIPYRTAVVLQQFIDVGAYPTLNPPLIKKDGVDVLGEMLAVNIGDNIQLTNSNGTSGSIYYTVDGTDPRAIGGGLSTSAIEGGDETSITVNTTIILKARVLDGTTWSAMNELMLSVADPLGSLRITEIHYNPLDQEFIDGGELEFVELKNTGAEAINLTGISFTDGIEYSFNSSYSLDPDSFVVIASNATAFRNEYGFEATGQFTGSLKNSGEHLELQNAVNSVVIDLTYNDQTPWPVSADGLGNSMVSYIHDPEGNPGVSAYWKASSLIGGSPGMDDPDPVIEPIYITEVLSNSDQPTTDIIELYNPNASIVNIGNWLLSDAKGEPSKWQIPAGTNIAANSYMTFNEGHYNVDVLEYTADEFGSGFSISSHGEDIYLISADADTNFTGYSTGVSFEEEETNNSFGRFENSIGNIHFVAQESNTFGVENSDPRIGPLVFKQIMYHPNEFNYEYVEIINIADSTVNLWAPDNAQNTWKISGVDFSFPTGVSLTSGESLFVIQGGITAGDFRNKYMLDGAVQVYNMAGKLSNDGESIKLKKPGAEYIDNLSLKHEYILIEEVAYNDNAPWSINADGNGSALVRIMTTEYGNDPSNWDDGFNIAPALTADQTDNDVEHAIDISFVEDVSWRAAITEITINRLTVDPGDYTISMGNINFASSLFATPSRDTITVLATDYYPGSVVQSIMGTTPPPALTADNIDNYIGEEIVVTFTDDQIWRDNITHVLIDDNIVAASAYNVSPGTLTFDGEQFPVAYSYTISVESFGYIDTEVSQEALAYELAPALTADNTSNYPAREIEISFEDDANWRSAIRQVSINSEELGASFYSINAGKIIFDSDVFENTKDYEVSVSAEFYEETGTRQQIVEELINSITMRSSDPSINVYPNPSDGIFNIASHDDIKLHQFKVLNLQGQVLEQGTIDQSELSLDMSRYQSNIYVLLITHELGTSYTRIVKN